MNEPSVFMSFLPLLIIIGIFVFIWKIVKYIGKSISNRNINVSTQSKYSSGFGKSYKEVLLENNLDKYITTFEENNLTDYSVLSEINEKDLEKIGISIIGDRKKIIKLFTNV